MLRFNAPDSNKGFTLVEIMVIVVVIGILSAITAPSLMAMFSRSKVNAAVAEIQGALQEAQRQTIRTGANCTLNLISNSITGNCLPNGNRVFTALSIHASVNQVSFDHKGRVSSVATVVVTTANSNLQKCLVLSSPLGLIRSGTYKGVTGTTNASDCVIKL